jgi:beta-glucosidase
LCAGLDIEMPYRMVRAQHLRDALDLGDAVSPDVDAAVERVVATRLRFDAILSRPAPPLEALGAPDHRRLAREVAARSAVLLRNEPVEGVPVLPLDAGAAPRVAVLGRLADRVNLGDGGSSDVWDLDCHTVLDGLRAALGDVVHDDGSDPRRAATVAGAADVAIVVVGYTHLDEGEYIGPTAPELAGLFPSHDEPDVIERFRARCAGLAPTTKPAHIASRAKGFSMGGDRGSLRLLQPDVELIRAAAAANPRTVVVMQAGSAVVATEWVDAVPAVVQSWYGGCQAGPGLADVLVGKVNPSARLPFTVPADEADLPAFERDATRFRYDRWHGWWHLARHGRTPAFPFGFGLSYTTFTLDEIDVSAHDGAVAVRGAVDNTGDRDGADVVQVYAELPHAGAPTRLVAFTRVEIPAGGRAAFEVAVPLERLATRNPDRHEWTAPRGRHRFVVARFAGDPRARAAVVGL